MNEDYCLWMGDIDPKMDESIIRNLLKFYNVYPLEIKLIKNVKTNKNKNYCFIYFKNIFEANRTLNQLKGKQISNTPFKFKLNWANYLTSETKIVFVGNLNPLVDDISLLNFFKSKYRSALKAKIITDNGKSKKYGFVTFKKGNDYRKSLIEMNGAFFEGTNIRVREYKRKDEDVDENDKNNQENLKNINTDDKIKLKNGINNNINNNLCLLNMNNLNSSSFLSISNSINRLNWISDANPINDVIIGINNNNDTIVNNKNNWFNQNKYNNGYNQNNDILNFNNSIKCNSNFEMFNNNDINKINNNSKNNNIIINDNQTNKREINTISKLEILEEFDEKTLILKINESLNKILEYYKKNILINGNHVESKLFKYLIFV